MENIRNQIKIFFLRILNIPFAFLMHAIDLIMWPIQKIVGVRNMPYIFLLPNLIFFGLFVIVPLIANFFFSLSSGDELLFAERELPTTKQYDQLFDCESYLNPNTCTEDFFLRGVYNTLFFVTVNELNVKYILFHKFKRPDLAPSLIFQGRRGPKIPPVPKIKPPGVQSRSGGARQHRNIKV